MKIAKSAGDGRWIIARAGYFMALCDQLEAQSAQSQRDCDTLLSAIVNQVESVS
jgi:cobyrinic acid a,c-diamide synthase